MELIHPDHWFWKIQKGHTGWLVQLVVGLVEWGCILEMVAEEEEGQGGVLDEDAEGQGRVLME